jgi:tetratricopeptide (TPR) repeat protein
MKRCGVPALIFRLALFLVPAGAAAPQLHAQARREARTLSGNVYFAGGNHPAENISVELHSNEGMLIAPQMTDSNGWFEFRSLERSVYAIEIHADGFEPVSLKFDLFYSSSRGNVVYLKPLLKKSDQPPAAARVSTHELFMPASARALMRSGKKKLYQDKDAQASLADFEAAVAAAPGYYEAWCQIAMAYLTLGKLDDAEMNFRKATELSGGTYGEAQIGLGTVMLDRGDSAGAEKIIRRGIDLSPDLWMGHYELGRALLNENKLPEAKESAALARSLAPSTPIIYRLLSNIHLLEKNYPALLEDLDAYIQLDPASPAGLRARQLREQVQQKIATERSPPPAPPKP